MIMRKLSLILLFTLISTLSLFAKAKVLIVSGTGATENEAIENAISEAMTHGYMSFINSKEETIDEDIQTSEEVTSFNPDIKLTGYNLLSSEKTNNGYNVKVEVQFKKTPFLAQTYGKMFSTAGKMFAQSIGISTKEKQKTPQEEVLERIRTKNELAVHEALKNALALRLDNLFDYKVKVGEGANGKVPVEISVIQNKNTKAFCRLLYQTLYFSSHSAFNFDVKDGAIVHDGYAFPYAKVWLYTFTMMMPRHLGRSSRLILLLASLVAKKLNYRIMGTSPLQTILSLPVLTILLKMFLSLINHLVA